MRPASHNITRPVKVPGTPEWRDYRACWSDHSTPSMAFGPVLRVIVNGCGGSAEASTI